MTTQPQAQCTDSDAEELVQRQQPPRRGSMNPADPNGGLLLQSIALRQSDGRKRDDEKRHQAVVGEAFAEHVDDAGLPCRAEERESGHQAGNERGCYDDESRTEAESETNDDNRNPTEL
jgi:hypothetical protein